MLCGSPTPQFDLTCNVDDEAGIGVSSHSAAPPRNDDDEIGETKGANERIGFYSPSISRRRTQINRISLPLLCHDFTFQQCFFYLHESMRVITFGIFRKSSRRNGNPTTIICPDARTKMQFNDDLFVFTQ